MAIIALGAALTGCSPERALDGTLGAVSGAVVAGPVGLGAGGIVGATAGPAIASSWGVRSILVAVDAIAIIGVPEPRASRAVQFLILPVLILPAISRSWLMSSPARHLAF